jgi:hypothetical protein
LTISGTGWDPNTTVELTLHSTPVPLGTTETADDGTFTQTVTIPADTATGAHTIEVAGFDAHGDAATVDVANTVTSTPTAPQGTLPFTGGPILPLTIVGLGAMGAGLALVWRRRASA